VFPSDMPILTIIGAQPQKSPLSNCNTGVPVGKNAGKADKERLLEAAKYNTD